MSRLKSRFILHLLLLFALFLVILILLVFPSNVMGRSPLVTIEHHDKSLPSLSQESRSYQNSSREREARRRVDEAQRAKERAYVPRNPLDYQAQQWEQWQADRNLDNAQRDLRRIQSDEYLKKRIIESHQRDQKIQEHINEQKGKK